MQTISQYKSRVCRVKTRNCCRAGCAASPPPIRPWDYARKALIDARRCGIHSFCITIATQDRDYPPHMYGPANYVVVDEAGKLPLKVANVYRRLTV